jgi:hypothetical protein
MSERSDSFGMAHHVLGLVRVYDARPSSLAQEADWITVSGSHPCRLCGGEADCRFHSREPFASCVSRQSDWPLTSGDWLHRIDP